MRTPQGTVKTSRPFRLRSKKKFSSCTAAKSGVRKSNSFWVRSNYQDISGYGQNIKTPPITVKISRQLRLPSSKTKNSLRTVAKSSLLRPWSEKQTNSGYCQMSRTLRVRSKYQDPSDYGQNIKTTPVTVFKNKGFFGYVWKIKFTPTMVRKSISFRVRSKSQDLYGYGQSIKTPPSTVKYQDNSCTVEESSSLRVGSKGENPRLWSKNQKSCG